MLNRFKSVVENVMGGIQSIPHNTEKAGNPESLEIKYAYARPDFLQLTHEEVHVSADHASRPILVPRSIERLPWNAGYAEVINGGKSKYNEDQAKAVQFMLKPPCVQPNSEDNRVLSKKKTEPVELKHITTTNLSIKNIPCTYFAIFDGHAGTGAALMAMNLLDYHVKEKLLDCIDLILSKKGLLPPQSPGAEQNSIYAATPRYGMTSKESSISVEDLVCGALEAAFVEMDNHIARERTTFRIIGGCTALVALFFMDKLYVANAGDCRAVIVKDGTSIQMSKDFTPESERQRLQYLGYLQPELLHNEFTHLDFPRRVHKKDIGKRMLYRDAQMSGWAYKTVEEGDLKFPLVFGDGKRARVLATIGVTRGFGDHDLMVHDSNIHIKPFLTPVPEVKVYDMTSCKHSEDDVLILGSDGYWDVTSNEKTVDLVLESLKHYHKGDQSRYTRLAQDLVMFARGLLKGRAWKTEGDKSASGDDITIFAIPLYRYKPLNLGKSRTSQTNSIPNS
ncbi:protein phosphatase 1H isoform X1 [Lingula anatina]|uniref:Protein phosphatase 1H isoform X1 n=1 Tax=Lingula anatina TaxID=7574 RepID=A0A1S3JLC3_LINAN|nr:protein phosphatase 1H isoform X1 [Lingula anatina]|eukprot:XP_013411210.1 protein phosphatase 1H isoform X1 [Lingula anatina]